MNKIIFAFLVELSSLCACLSDLLLVTFLIHFLGKGEKDADLGEGGDTGELAPGKSLVFAAMELLVFILVRHLPQLNTRVKESPSHVPLRPQRLPEESARLVANTVYILAELPSLCSPAGEARGT